MAEPTLVDVARVAGVSRATAARVLAGRTNVDAGMTAAVEHAAKQLGYEANGAARMLRGGRADSIALIVAFHDLDRLPGTILTAVLKGAAASLHAQGIQPILLPADHNDSGRVSRLLRSRAIDGAIVILQNEMTEVTQTLANSSAPIAWVGRPRVGLAENAIVVDADNYGGGRLAARTLAESGRRRLGIIAGPHDMKPARERLRGWRDELVHLGIDYTPLVHGAFTIESGLSAMVRLLQRHPDLDGVFASSDLMANGAIHALQASGRHVPTDVSVVGFDDVAIAITTNPPLTTIRQPLADMGRVAAETVVAILHGREVDRQPILATHLVQRESA
ncbi:DNA-binding transcriptional regulator, LacI/PurR family [Rathayibacter oskolensis]|uniref:DNA-binding transcriptional regulator, LacI/PurR family n=1 Tax=Rathayibacter oskolensis TaxID=1891671 RepID=A0A1X7NK12_9MICO|nr:LacI family DNA-binding transcriptional regulator [Rathayibacter oskolensis]SMH38248.1 DNA-binding transcriptional regulator, LacI/PurR family [Rathayibacter oskolensis]